jgi:hypothetical protein
LQGVTALLAAFAPGCLEDQHAHFPQATSEPPVTLFIVLSTKKILLVSFPH